ncbi:MAG: proton-conducting transporter membrane subunit [Nitrospiraceae bacterium]
MDILLSLIVILSPLLASAAAKIAAPAIGERCSRFGVVALWISALCSIVVLFRVFSEGPIRWVLDFAPSLSWLNLIVDVDRLAAIMMTLISSVSLVIHVYSARYMTGDVGYRRFFVLLSLVTGLLLACVSSGSLVWMAVSWHAVSWLLAALLRFNRASPAAQAAGQRTLWIQILGDVAFVAGALVLALAFGTVDLREVFARIAEAPTPFALAGVAIDPVGTAALCFLLTVMTKSAQVPFHIWLPGTVEAPTPVSALMHAGIVNAGGFLVNRFAPVFGATPSALYLMFVIGAVTALVGATTMLTQSSVKRTLVYSTIGQMGYMVMECGLGAFALAVFHLCAHGLFKATLFLNSGSQIHKARVDFRLPPHGEDEPARPFSWSTWATGFGVTLVLPLIILLAAHGVVQIPLLDAQGTVIFLFFGWVTSSQAMFSLYRLPGAASWKVASIMVGALTLVGLTYLWAGETFTHLLYPVHGEAERYFAAAEWPRGLFDLFIAVAAVLVIAAWGNIYAKEHGHRWFAPGFLEARRVRFYVAFLNGLYTDEILRAKTGGSPLRARRPVGRVAHAEERTS